ncbi:flagellar motor switch phosphatase FliY [Bacillus thermotolerans]|uniref:flagellar motor switch phosphatase FliY n=1 Tax=Bacillus thermotolerans TaxID=1221996 RepID=UPI00058917DE|nr:flagellar motor switch phosphatase FliY [Bacillus thermotolerans]KKB44676.1 Flagellar motor switch protein FliN [Bacillus thermotolerans]
MNDHMLSQEEIDALLKGTADVDTERGVQAEQDTDKYLEGFEKDALGEIGNISFGSSATALSSLLNQKVDITTPAVTVINRHSLKDEFPLPYVAIEVEYTQGFTGATNLLVIQQKDAAIIADLMLGGTGLDTSPELGELQLSAVQEAMNQMMGSAATSMSTIFNKRVDISPPSINLLDLNEGTGEEKIQDLELLVKISFRLRIGHLIDSNIMQLVPLDFAKDLVAELMGAGIEQPEKGERIQPQPAPAADRHPEGNQAGRAQKTMPVRQNQPSENMRVQQKEVNIQPAVFSSFDTAPSETGESRNLNMLMDIPLQVTVELGRTSRSVKEVLELSAGSIIELDKLAGEPVDVFINSRLIAKGEVVVIDENFGVRITDILNEKDRLKNL